MKLSVTWQRKSCCDIACDASQDRSHQSRAYTSAVAGRVSEYVSAEQLQTYAGPYTQISKIRPHQEDGWTTDAVFALLKLPGLPKTDAIQLEERNALAKLRDNLDSIRGQGALLRNSAKRELGIEVSEAEMLNAPMSREAIRNCEMAAASLPQPD